MISDFLQQINLSYMTASAIIFLGGIYFGPVAVDNEVTSLLRYPRWIRRVMEQYFRPEAMAVLIFGIIFFLNNFSLFASFLSGVFIFFPILAAFFTGFNVAVISYELAGWQGIWQVLVNPVAWLEFPAAWMSFALGLQLAEVQLGSVPPAETMQAITELAPTYFTYVLPLLLIAAILETVIIKMSSRFMDEE